jgi:hypothetical protein
MKREQKVKQGCGDLHLRPGDERAARGEKKTEHPARPSRGGRRALGAMAVPSREADQRSRRAGHGRHRQGPASRARLALKEWRVVPAPWADDRPEGTAGDASRSTTSRWPAWSVGSLVPPGLCSWRLVDVAERPMKMTVEVTVTNPSPPAATVSRADPDGLATASRRCSQTGDAGRVRAGRDPDPGALPRSAPERARRRSWTRLPRRIPPRGR